MSKFHFAHMASLSGIAVMLLGAAAFWTASADVASAQRANHTQGTHNQTSHNSGFVRNRRPVNKNNNNNVVNNNNNAAAVDPGVREGPAGVGAALPTLSADEAAFFDSARDIFQEVDDVALGLGPRFNADGCAVCHAFPAVGGTSPLLNPQVAIATKAGATNTVPSF